MSYVKILIILIFHNNILISYSEPRCIVLLFVVLPVSLLLFFFFLHLIFLCIFNLLYVCYNFFLNVNVYLAVVVLYVMGCIMKQSCKLKKIEHTNIWSYN